jgi:hypothetical protein
VTGLHACEEKCFSLPPGLEVALQIYCPCHPSLQGHPCYFDCLEFGRDDEKKREELRSSSNSSVSLFSLRNGYFYFGLISFWCLIDLGSAFLKKKLWLELNEREHPKIKLSTSPES